MKRFAFPFVLLLGAVAVAQPEIPRTEPLPKSKDTKRTVRVPQNLAPFKPKSLPEPMPVRDAAAPVKLAAGQFYVIASGHELLTVVNGGIAVKDAGEVTITKRKPPFSLPVEVAVGYTPDPADPDVVTFTEPFLYVVKAKKTGPVTLQLIPALNAFADSDPKGLVKQVPLTEADITYHPIDVFAGEGPRPPPNGDEKKEESPAPRPQPPPVPPEPKPQPKAGPLWLVFVDDTLSLTTTKIVTNQQFLDRMKAAGHKVHRYAAEDPAAIRGGYVQAATVDKGTRKAPGTPALIVVDEDGDVIRAVQRPGTVDEVEDLVREVTRK